MARRRPISTAATSGGPICRSPPLGEEELRQLKAYYRYPEAERVYSSPLARCRKTATILYPRVPVSEVEGLREADFGVFEGKTPYALKDDPDYQAGCRAAPPPEGEASEAFVRRVLEGFVGILDDMKAREIRSAAVITHGGVIMTILAALACPSIPRPTGRPPRGRRLYPAGRCRPLDAGGQAGGLPPDPPTGGRRRASTASIPSAATRRSG